jgi:dimethylaniline monooxygenase (N-oxide forming)
MTQFDYFILAEYSKYLHEYAVHFGLYPYIRFEHGVQKIERISGEKQQWRVQVRQGTDCVEWYNEIFDRVAICSGTHQKRAMPTFVNAEDFKGKIIHMQDVKRFDEFKGKHVCVVGSGEAASDMALAASKHGQRAFLSIRRDHGYLVSRYPYGPQEPADLQTTRVRYSIPTIFILFQIIIRMYFEKVFSNGYYFADFT